jgi:hypothetical protein
MHYELWDLVSRNLLYDFDTLDEAVEAARELTSLNADHYPEELALGRSEDDSGFTWLARGADLADMWDVRRTST